MFTDTGEWINRLKSYVRKPLSPRQTEALKKTVKLTKTVALQGRSLLCSIPCARPPLTNLYHACVQKTGSQWVRAVLSDARIQRHTGLATFPQFRYEWVDVAGNLPELLGYEPTT